MQYLVIKSSQWSCPDCPGSICCSDMQVRGEVKGHRQVSGGQASTWTITNNRQSQASIALHQLQAFSNEMQQGCCCCTDCRICCILTICISVSSQSTSVLTQINSFNFPFLAMSAGAPIWLESQRWMILPPLSSFFSSFVFIIQLFLCMSSYSLHIHGRSKCRNIYLPLEWVHQESCFKKLSGRVKCLSNFEPPPRRFLF